MDKCKHFVKNRDGVYYCDSKKCMSRNKSKCTLYHGYDKKVDKLSEFMEKEASKFGVYKCLTPIIEKNSVEMKALKLAAKIIDRLDDCRICPVSKINSMGCGRHEVCTTAIVKRLLSMAKGCK